MSARDPLKARIGPIRQPQPHTPRRGRFDRHRKHRPM